MEEQQLKDEREATLMMLQFIEKAKANIPEVGGHPYGMEQANFEKLLKESDKPKAGDEQDQIAGSGEIIERQ